MDKVVEVRSTVVLAIKFVVFSPKIGIQMRDSVLKNFGYDVSFVEFVLSADTSCRSIDPGEFRVEL